MFVSEFKYQTGGLQSEACSFTWPVVSILTCPAASRIAFSAKDISVIQSSVQTSSLLEVSLIHMSTDSFHRRREPTFLPFLCWHCWRWMPYICALRISVQSVKEQFPCALQRQLCLKVCLNRLCNDSDDKTLFNTQKGLSSLCLKLRESWVNSKAPACVYWNASLLKSV